MKTDGLKSLLPNISAIILTTVVLATAAVSFVREHYADIFTVSINSPSKSDFNSWNDAVRKGNLKKALLLAEKIAGSRDTAVPESDYMKLVLGYEMSTLILTSGFCKYDFYRWKDCCIIEDILGKELSGKHNPEEIFAFIKEKIEYRQPVDGKIPPIMMADIISRGFGSAPDIARTASEFLFQAGYDTAVVTRLTASNDLIDILCEIRKGNEVWTADPRSGLMIKGLSIVQTISGIGNPFSPDNAKYSAGVKLLYCIPAEYQDYRILNQNLAASITKIMEKANPGFGKDPHARIERYLDYFPGRKVDGQITYWRYPFYILRAQSDYPADWTLKSINRFSWE